MALRDHDRNALSSQPRLAGFGRLALAVAAGVILAEGFRHAAYAAPAEAQRAIQGGILNPADQRNEMIVQLRKLNDRLADLERALSSDAFDVNVLSMPSGGAAPTGD